jgi:hypothetical protein
LQRWRTEGSVPAPSASSSSRSITSTSRFPKWQHRTRRAPDAFL